MDFYPLKVASFQRLPGDGAVLTFDVARDVRDRFAFKPGQFLTLRASVEGEEVRRSYSIAAGPREPLRIGVKRVPGGRFSSYVHERVSVGDLIEVLPPQGRFVLPISEGQDRHVIAVAAGSGITPVLGLARQALLHEPRTRFTLIYGNRTRDGVMFGEEIEALKDQFLGRFDYIPVFSRLGEVDAPLFEGRITGERLTALAAALTDFKGAEHVFLCGPGDMIKSCRDALFELGLTREQVVHEFFAPPSKTARAAPVAASEPTDGGPVVTVILDGSRHQLHLKVGETVLQAALAAGLKAPYACAGGMCSTCRAKIVSGSARMLLNYSLEPWEIEKGFTLACQAVPTSESLVVDWDAM